MRDCVVSLRVNPYPGNRKGDKLPAAHLETSNCKTIQNGIMDFVTFLRKWFLFRLRSSQPSRDIRFGGHVTRKWGFVLEKTDKWFVIFTNTEWNLSDESCLFVHFQLLLRKQLTLSSVENARWRPRRGIVITRPLSLMDGSFRSQDRDFPLIQK